MKTIRYTGTLGLIACLGMIACQDVDGMDAKNPQRGPGELVGNGEPITDGNFPGGFDEPPAARETEPPTSKPILCDGECEAYCESLDLTNPVNIGMCKSTWGVGIETQAIDRRQACRKLYVDMIGRYPTPAEINDVCSNEDWGETVKSLMATPEFVLVQQRRWSDLLLYNNRITNIERIFDMDDLVRKVYQGYVPWDLFAAVTVSHPVLVRRYATPGDRAEAVFRLFLHRPPYEAERSDMGRMFSVWSNGYRDHSYLGTVPDAYINYDCVNGGENPSDEDIGQCTSILWGYNQLTLEPDERREISGEQEGLMWSGYLTADEWEQLQLPGRVMAQQDTFWEAAVDDVLIQYLGYDLGTELQAVRFELKNYLLENAADIRAVHYAVATSVAYLQSSQGYDGSKFRWAYGPLKQAPAEAWIDSVKRTTGTKLGTCDHRIPFPEDLLYDSEGNPLNGWAFALLNNSRWVIDNQREVVRDYQYLAQTLGGCPSNEVSSRFTTVSILGTAVTEAFVAEVCDPAVANQGNVAEISILLPEGMNRDQVLDETVAQDIVARQTRLFYGREPTEFELEAAVDYADQCTPKPCDAEHFARPVCFALLSGAEMIFY
ncbi:DUF1549 domain-containing protein [Nannocystaceae bacterium ST9]